MIQSDQPDCFPSEVIVRVSSREDGTVLDKAVGVHNPLIVTNRTKFCERNHISYGDVVYQRIIYGDDRTYDCIVNVAEQDTCKYSDEVVADALITADARVGMLLPVADCVATVLYDPITKQLALAHLGRHSTIANLMTKVISMMKQQGAAPNDIIVWMAPSVKQSHYRMEYFDMSDTKEWAGFAEKKPDGIYLDLQGYNRARAREVGVLEQNIHVSPINTATDKNYFSHSQGDTTDRFAVVAYRR